jgi:hypothetical protein
MAAHKTQLTLSGLMTVAALGLAGNASAWGINNLLTPVLKEGGRMVSGVLGPSKEERDRQITEALKQQYDPEKNREAFEAMLAQSGVTEEEKADARKRYEARMRAAQSEVGQQVAAQRAHSEAMAGSAADRIVRGAVGQSITIDAATAVTRLPGQATGMNAVTGAAEAAVKTGVTQATTKDAVKEAEEKAKSGNTTGQSSREKPVAELVGAGIPVNNSVTVRQGNEIDVHPGASNTEDFAAAMKMFAGIGRTNRQAANTTGNKPAEVPTENASGQVSEVAK